MASRQLAVVRVTHLRFAEAECLKAICRRFEAREQHQAEQAASIARVDLHQAVRARQYQVVRAQQGRFAAASGHNQTDV